MRSSPLIGFVLLALALSACGGTILPSPGADGVGAIVMISGRDDHGLLQAAEVPLLSAPEGDEVAVPVPDGTFAEVLEVRGTWLHVRSAEDPTASGWIDDFHLRDRAVFDSDEQVHFLAARVGDGGLEIEVRPVDGGPSHWVAAEHLVEVGAED